MAVNDKLRIGFDLGGTKMLAALVDDKNAVIARIKEKTDGARGTEEVVAGIRETIRKLLDTNGVNLSRVEGIAIAVPSPVNKKKGLVLATPNLGFFDYPLVQKIASAFPVSVLLENDVNAGTYGEFVEGAARGYNHVVGVFPGTGIGGGLILNGRLYEGAAGGAGELGHMIIQTDGPRCGCGRYGCVEALASRTAMAKDAVALSASGKIHFKDSADLDFNRFRSKFFSQALAQKDPTVEEIVRRAAWFLGIGIANCVNLLNPEIIVLGGGLVEKLGESYLRIVEESMRAHAMPSLAAAVKVKAAKLGDDSVVVGAACLLRTPADKV